MSFTSNRFYFEILDDTIRDFAENLRVNGLRGPQYWRDPDFRMVLEIMQSPGLTEYLANSLEELCANGYSDDSIYKSMVFALVLGYRLHNGYEQSLLEMESLEPNPFPEGLADDLESEGDEEFKRICSAADHSSLFQEYVDIEQDALEDSGYQIALLRRCVQSMIMIGFKFRKTIEQGKTSKSQGQTS